MNKNKNNSLDAMLLAFVKILSVGITLISTSVLSHVLDLKTFGTYSTGNLIVNTGAFLTILGLVDATNYYFHKETRGEDYLNTIFFMECVIGVVCAVVLLLGEGFLVRFFKNPQLKSIYLLLLFRPMLTNISSSLFVLQAAVGKAKALAVKGLSFSLVKLGAILVTSFLYQDIRIIFWTFLIFDIVSIWFFYLIFKHEAYPIRPFRFSGDLILPIIRFCFPMGIYLMAGELMKNIDKYVIGFFEPTEKLAVYSNISTQLPFNVISESFLTILIPIITLIVVKKQYEKGIAVLRDYLCIGYITNVTFTFACILFSKELILLLYGDKYLVGRSIFITYLFVDMLKFAGISLVMVTFERTKFLMTLSMITLGLNVVLNPLFYFAFGMIGPAIATLLITIGTVTVLLSTSVHALHGKMCQVFPPKKLSIFLAECLLVGTVFFIVKNTSFISKLPFFVILFVGGGMFCGSIFLLQFRELLGAMKNINQNR